MRDSRALPTSEETARLPVRPEVLPILISIPHGGTEIPPEIRHGVGLSARDLLDDSDSFTGEIFDLGSEVAQVVKADTARAFVDPNRDRNDLPPANPDGVVKTATCLGRGIYSPGFQQTPRLTQVLIDRYYEPYHARLRELVKLEGLKLALDCHSMLPYPPSMAPDVERPRPTFCISNNDGATCPHAWMEELALALASAFEVGLGEIGMNDPFKGGFITRSYGMRPLPWIQVEINRSLYLDRQWFDELNLDVDSRRLRDLRSRFSGALRQLAAAL